LLHQAKFTMSCIAIIPARGGSKGLPGKNVRMFAGKPLLFWTIDAALRCAGIDEVYVSTDCPKIRALACRYGAKAPGLRPADLSTDTARSIDAVHHAVVAWADIQAVETVVMLQATSPLRTHHDISAALKTLRSLGPAGVDAVASVTCASKHPLKAYRLDDAGLLQPFVPRAGPVRTVNRQELPTAYQENGAIYAFWWNAHVETRANEASQGLLCGLHTCSVAPLIMTAAASHDIDCEEDWRTTEDEFIRRFFPSSPSLSMGGRLVGVGHPPFIIADISVAPGDAGMDAAIRLVRSAKAAGAEGVIFHMQQDPYAHGSDPADASPDKGGAQSGHKQAPSRPVSLAGERALKLAALAASLGLAYLAGPGSHAVLTDDEHALAKSCQVSGCVIPCSQGTDVAMLACAAAALEVPVLLTVAEAASVDDLRAAVDICEAQGTPLAILYQPPGPAAQHAKLHCLPDLRRSFPGAVIGVSDWSDCNWTCFGAVPLGASVLCKTFTHELGTAEPQSTIAPEPWLDLVKGCRAIWAACVRYM